MSGEESIRDRGLKSPQQTYLHIPYNNSECAMQTSYNTLSNPFDQRRMDDEEEGEIRNNYQTKPNQYISMRDRESQSSKYYGMMSPRAIDLYNKEEEPFPSDAYYSGYNPSYDNYDIPKNYITIEKDPSRNSSVHNGISSSASEPLPSFIHNDTPAESFGENYYLDPTPYYSPYESYMNKPLSSSQNLGYQDNYPSNHYYFQEEENSNKMRHSGTFPDFDQSGYGNSFPSHNLISQQGAIPIAYQTVYPRMNRNVMISPKPVDSNRMMSNRISPFEEDIRDDSSYVSRGSQSYSSSNRNTRNKTNNKNSHYSSRKGNRDSSRNETPSHDIHNRERWSPNSIPLTDNEGNMISIVKTRHGCLNLQNEIDRNGVMMIDKICKELGNDLSILLNNQYGNYLFQKMISNATDEQKYRIIKCVASDLPIAAKNKHGTRCVQRMIEECNQDRMLQDIVQALLGDVYSIAASMDGNHVISKCLEIKPIRLRYPMYTAIIEIADQLSKEKYGVSVIHKCVDCFEGEFRVQLLDKLYGSVMELMQDSCGNYVIQDVINKASREESMRFCHSILDNVVKLSMLQCSSNVVECVISRCDEETREKVIEEIVTSSDLKKMITDNYGNYVIQKALQTSNKSQKERLSKAIQPYTQILESYHLGKNILSKINPFSF